MKHKNLRKIIQSPSVSGLPGLESQLKMAPSVRAEEVKKADLSSAVPSGVLLLFFPDQEDNSSLVLMRRPDYNGVHSGQISFPGGKMEDTDKDLTETALRETEEEIGVSRDRIQVVANLTELYIPPSHYIVQPVIGLTDHRPEFIPEPAEVAEIITVPLSVLLAPDCIHDMSVESGRYGHMIVPCFQYNGNRIWGATAMILSEALDYLRGLMAVSPGS